MAKQMVEIEGSALDRFEIVRLKAVGYFGTSPDELRATFEVRPKWQPPAWIKPGSWLWGEKDGLWWIVASEKPRQRDDGSWSAVSSVCSIINHNDKAIDFTPPPWTDAKSSLRQI